MSSSTVDDATNLVRPHHPSHASAASAEQSLQTCLRTDKCNLRFRHALHVGNRSGSVTRRCRHAHFASASDVFATTPLIKPKHLRQRTSQPCGRKSQILRVFWRQMGRIIRAATAATDIRTDRIRTKTALAIRCCHWKPRARLHHGRDRHLSRLCSSSTLTPLITVGSPWSSHT